MSGRVPRDPRERPDAAPAHPARRWLVLACFAAAAAVLGWRAVDLQVNHKEFLQRQGDVRHLRVVEMPAHRGKLLDRNGEPLAVSTPVESVWVNPRDLIASRPRWNELTGLLDLDPGSLAHLVETRADREFVYLERHVDPDTARAVEALRMPGVHLQREYRRYYPAGELAGHMVGFTNVDDVGQEGLELAYDATLRGEPGEKRVLRDRLEDVESIRAPRPGRDLVLSVDHRIQYLAYRALLSAVRKHGARGGSAVVLDVRTGEVLAMVNQPSFNPNNVADRVSRRTRNRAMTDVFEPGSSVKPFTIAAALEIGAVRPDTMIDTSPGRLVVGKHTVRDLRDYGAIDVSTVIKKSSNVGAGMIGRDLEPHAMWDLLDGVGFGSPSASGFPGEASGFLPHFLDWREITRVTLSFGYGLSVTPLQLARAYAVLGNGGVLLPVSFLRLDAAPDGERVLGNAAAAAVRRMLESVVEPGGTGGRARVSGYRVGGKTGTSHKSIAGGYSEDRYFSVFAGVAPMSAPRIAIVAMVDEPRGDAYYGGQVAAPVFADIATGALRVLGLPPDDGSVVTRRVRMGRGDAGALARADVAAPEEGR